MPTTTATSVDLLRCTRYATYAYLLAVPGLVESLNLLGTHDTARALQAALCCLAILAWGQRFDPSTVRLTRTQTSLLGLAITLTLASIWQAQWPVFAATEACLWVGLVALVWVFAISPTQALTKEVPAVVVIAVLLMGLQELRDIAFAWLSSSSLDAGNLGYGHPNMRHFNHVQTMALIMAAMAIWYPTHRWMRWSAGFGVAVGLSLVWLSGARSTLLALFLIGLGFCALSGQARRIWSTRLLFLGAAALVAYLLFYVLTPLILGIEFAPGVALNERKHTGSIETRLVHWILAFEMAIQNPLTGWGGLHYATQHHVDAAHPHNIVLQWAAEWGWISTLLVLCALAWWTRSLWLAMWQRLRGGVWPHSPIVTAAWMAALAGWIDAMFSGTLTMPVSQVWWCCCLGIAQSAQYIILNNISAKRYQAHGYHKALLLMFMIGYIYILQATHQATQLFARSETGQAIYNKPRLWLFGTLDKQASTTKVPEI